MAMIDGRHGRLLAGLGVAAIVLPALLIAFPPAVEVSRPDPPAVAPLSVPDAPPPLVRAYARPLFVAASAGGAGSMMPGAPELVGIVGRIDRDAVAMVRTADGSTRTLRIGESVDGWRLASLAPDAAYFTRGGEQARASMPGAEPADGAGPEAAVQPDPVSDQ